jgi:uncharacterized RDD family membrane protein YckC
MTDILFTEEFQSPLAKKRLRVFAAFIDYALFFTFLLFIAFNYGEKTYLADGTTSFRLTGTQPLILVGFWFAILPLCESFKGQSLGKMILKIRVVSFDYERASFIQCLARHLFDLVDWLPGFGIVGLLVSSNNERKQRVGDLVAKTVVINL